MAPASKASPSGYLRQLDSVRTIAVAMVIATHWIPKATTFWFNGGMGVKVFFVLSGFLITGILLDARGQADQSGVGRTAVLKNFYARRFLRIFPLFYATLALTFLLGVPTVRQFIWWLMFYLGNVLLALHGQWLSGIAHFWSLAVEEQFYLVWPVLILFHAQAASVTAYCFGYSLCPTFPVDPFPGGNKRRNGWSSTFRFAGYVGAGSAIGLSLERPRA